MKLPRFSAGKPLISQVTAGKLNAIADAIESLEPLPGKGTRLRRTRQGFSYSAEPGTGTRLRTLPWQLSAGPDDSIKVYPGALVIEGVSWMPYIDGIPLDAEDSPVLHGDGLMRVFLKVEALWREGEGEIQLEVSGSPSTIPILHGIDSVQSVSVIAQSDFPDRSDAAAGSGLLSASYLQLGTRYADGGFAQSAYGPGVGRETFGGYLVDAIDGHAFGTLGLVNIEGTPYS